MAKIEQVSRLEWINFVEESPQNGLFVSPDFISDSNGQAQFFLAYDRRQPRAGSIHSIRNSRCGQWFDNHSLVLDPSENMRAARGSFAHATIVGELIETVVSKSKNGGRLSFHPSIVDVRAVQWLLDDLGLEPIWNQRFKGLVNLDALKVRGNLRRSLTKASKFRFETVSSSQSRHLTSILEMSEVPDIQDNLLWISETSKRLIDRGIASVVFTQDPIDTDTRAASLVVEWRNTAYVLFGGACGQSLSRQYVGPVRDNFILTKAIEANLAFVDLLGMEGRSRALYKSGWVTDLVSWSEVIWGAN